MAGKKVDYFRGDDWVMEWTLTADNVAVDISGYTVNFSYKKDDATTVTIVGSIVDASAGRVDFAPATTDFDTAGFFIYEVSTIDVSGKKRTYVQGTLEVIDDINKA